MNSKLMVGGLTMLGLLALSATGAQAGGGGFPTPLTSFFVCNSISGEAPGQAVDVEANLLGPERQNVKIGNATLACAFTRLFQGGNEVDPGSANQLKCYTISGSHQPGAAPPPHYSAFDAFFPGGTDIKGSSFKYICGPASIFP